MASFIGMYNWKIKFMDQDQVKVLVDDVTDVHIEIDGVDIHILELAEPLRSSKSQKIFLDFSADVDERDILISQLMNQDLMDMLMKKMATYHIENTNTYFVFPGISSSPTDKQNRFKFKMMLMSPTDEDPIEDKFTTLKKS